MLPIPKCEVIDKLVEILHANKLDDMSKTAFIGVQHMLETTLSLFEGLIRCGAKADHMFFTGKSYSNCEAVMNKALAMGIHLIDSKCHSQLSTYRTTMMKNMHFMWEKFEEYLNKHSQIDTIIILDEGGRCREVMPNYLKFEYRLAIVEQTTGGLNSKTADACIFPIIEVASCTVKRLLEPPLIANTIIEKLRAYQPKSQPNSVMGIIGTGAIGSAIVRLLTQKGFKVFIYDKQDTTLKHDFGNSVYRLDSVESVIENADCIFGCSGYDITQGIDIFDLCKKDKTFISCSSEDKEFFSLLNLIYKNEQHTIDPQNNIMYTTNFASTITILKGGFPINFDHSGISVKASDIQITRGLLLGACIQASKCAQKLIGHALPKNKGSRYMVDPFLQRFLVKCWEKEQKGNLYYQALFRKFHFIPWIIEQSNGMYDEKSTFNLEPEAVLPSATPHNHGKSIKYHYKAI